MADTLLSSNMNLPIPIVGQDPGPQYALDVNSCLTIVDQHNHTPGLGVQVPTAGLNINADLPFGNFNLTGVRSVRFNAQLSPLALLTDVGCLYEAGVDLYYNDGNGNQVRITQSGGVVGTPGSITGLVPPASVTYIPGDQTFVFQSDVNTSANLDAGSLIIRENIASAKGVTISSPASLANDYNITLLQALPSTTAAIAISPTGELSTIVGGNVPTGVILPYGGAAAPTGFLLCDGSVVSQATYAALYAVISSSFNTGGEGAGNFRLPGQARNVLMGAGGAGTGTIGNAVGNTGGEEDHALTSGENGTHGHAFSGNTSNESSPHQHNVPVYTSTGAASPTRVVGTTVGSVLGTPSVDTLTGGNTTNHTHSYSGTTSNSGSGTAHNTIQPSLIVNFIIKT